MEKNANWKNDDMVSFCNHFTALNIQSYGKKWLVAASPPPLCPPYPYPPPPQKAIIWHNAYKIVHANVEVGIGPGRRAHGLGDAHMAVGQRITSTPQSGSLPMYEAAFNACVSLCDSRC